MKLYYAPMAPNPDRVRFFLQEKGIWDQTPKAELNIIKQDHRQPAYLALSPLGHVPGARLIPLGTLKDKAAELKASKPMVMVCRSGARSAQATVLLRKAGFEQVANLAGGMLRWRAQRFAVAGGRD